MPLEAHPVGFKWVVEAQTKNDATVVVVDPRFNRSAAVADLYAPIRAGSDTAFLLGVIRYLLENNRVQHDYVRHYTNASLIIRDDYQFDDGLFSGYDDKSASTINRAGSISLTNRVMPCVMKHCLIHAACGIC